MAFALQPFDACDPLLDYVKEHALELVGPYGLGDGYWGGGPWMMEDMAMEGAAASGAGLGRYPQLRHAGRGRLLDHQRPGSRRR